MTVTNQPWGVNHLPSPYVDGRTEYGDKGVGIFDAFVAACNETMSRAEAKGLRPDPQRWEKRRSTPGLDRAYAEWFDKNATEEA